MKKVLAITLALFSAGSLVKTVHAADLGTEFGVADDLGVYGTQGTATDPDVKIKGFSVFGATQAAPALNIPAAPGNIFVNGYVQISSGLYVAGSSTFTAGLYSSGVSSFTSGPGSIYVSGGVAGQILKKVGGGGMAWGDSVSGSGNQYYIPMWNDAAGLQLGNSVLIQEAGGGGVTATSSMTVNGLFEARSNALLGGTLGVTGAAVLSDKLHVAGTATVVSSMTVRIGRAHV